MLTSGFLTDLIERVWIEAKRHTVEFVGYQVEERGAHGTGNIFAHLMDNGMDIRVDGETVGMFATAADGTQSIIHNDQDYPGGIYYNMNSRDTERAEYVLEHMEERDFATFTLMLTPNDHTGGTAPCSPPSESEIADNDEAYALYEAWLHVRAESMPRIEGAPMYEETILRAMAGEVPSEQVQRVHRVPSLVPELVQNRSSER